MQILDKDKALIRLLRTNARASLTDLAKSLGVSRATVQKRLERLQDADVITGFTVQLSRAITEREVQAHVLVTVKPRMTDQIVEHMRDVDGVRAVHSVSGPHDLIVEVAADSVARLDRAIDEIIAIDGVERTVSSVILSTRIRQ